jgi:hypothetical protein
MPNWCSNKVTVSGDLIKFKTWLNGEPFCLNKIVPIDKTLLEGQGWYDWRINNWGTKWDVEAVAEDLGDTIVFNFETAWGPPRMAIVKLCELFPEINIVHSYLELGMCFVGKDVYSKADLITGEIYEDPDKEEWKQLAKAEFDWEPYCEE